MSSSEQQSARFAAIFASGTLFSRLLGLARDVILAAWLPLEARSMFFVAFRIPNTFRDLVGEGAMNAAFIPVFSATLAKKDKAAFRSLLGASFTAMLLVLGVLTLAGMAVIPLLPANLNDVSVVTGGDLRGEVSLEHLAGLTRWMFPYIFFVGLAIFAMGPLFVLKHYATPSWTPAILSLCVIAGAWVMIKTSVKDLFPHPLYVLVAAVCIGGILHAAVHFVALRRHVGPWRPNMDWRNPAVVQISMLMIPVFFGQAAGELNKFVNILFAASLSDRAVNALEMSNRLVQLPLAVFGIATSIAILPRASQSHAENDMEGVRQLLQNGYRQSFFLMAPAMLGLIVLALPIVRLLFQWGQFDSTQTLDTVQAVTPYAWGLIAFAWVKISLTGFYAAQDTKSPVIIASAAMLLNVLLNFALVRPFGFVGLAYGTTISYFVNFGLLFYFLTRQYGRLWDSELVSGLVRMTAACGMMSVVAYAVSVRAESIFETTHLLGRLLAVFTPMLAAGLTYLAVSALLRVPELGHFAAAIGGRLRR